MLKICIQCDNEFEASICHPYTKCCSESCRQKSYRSRTGYSKNYYERTRKKRLEISRASYQRNKERHAKNVKDWKDRHPDYEANAHNNRKFGGNRNKALERDKYTCQNCGSNSQLVVHHLNPPSNKLEDLQTLCRKCHPKAHNQSR